MLKYLFITILVILLAAELYCEKDPDTLLSMCPKGWEMQNGGKICYLQLSGTVKRPGQYCKKQGAKYKKLAVCQKAAIAESTKNEVIPPEEEIVKPQNVCCNRGLP